MMLCWIGGPADAAKLSCQYFNSSQSYASSKSCLVGLLSGQIDAGDYEKVSSFVAANHSTLRNFSLNSPGGSVNEALEIGRLFRSNLFKTVVDDPSFCGGRGCYCVSACALIWFGGAKRSGTVGLHRPWTDDPQFRGLSAPEASAEYRQVLAKIVSYLNEMEVPNSIIESMVNTSSSDIRWVDSSTDGLERPPSIAEWEDASCGQSPEHSGGVGWDDLVKYWECVDRLHKSSLNRSSTASMWPYFLLGILILFSVRPIMRRLEV